MFDAGGAEKKKPEKLEKPEKPDEEAYKAALKKAEKDHADAMTKFVCFPCCMLRHLTCWHLLK